MTEPRTPLRALLVEASATDAEILVLALARAGVAVEWRRVEDARAFDEALRDAAWDVVLSDHRPPAIDAEVILSTARRCAPDAPVIFVADAIGEELAVKIVRAGANDFLLKHRLDALGAAVEREVCAARLRADRRAALERLHASERRLKAIVDQVIVGIAQVGFDGRFTLANQKYAEIVGRSIADVLSSREEDFTHAADASVLARARAVDDASSPRSFALEKRYVRPDGSHVWVNASASVLSDGIVIVVEDITVRRGIEQERERLVQELERTVKLSETFAGVLGHDLRNPLMAISVGASMLLRSCVERGAADLAETLSRIIRSSDRMRRMVEQLLDFTRIRTGNGIPLEVQHVDLLSVVQHVVDELAIEGDTHRVRLETHGDCAGEWDRDRLLQLVSNLVANALHHREAGSDVLLRLSGEDRGRVRLEVENRGAIPPSILPTIFEPLQTTKSAMRDRASGLGLGLFITRQIVRAHGGVITVASDADRGTRFVVDLPRKIPYTEKDMSSASFQLAVPSSDGRAATAHDEKSCV